MSLRCLSALLLLPGCFAYSRVALPPVPLSDAPPMEREQALRDLAIVAGETTTWSDSLRPDATIFRDLEWVTLGNGLQVEDPRDLEPAVLPGSETAALLDAYDAEVTRTTWTKVIVMAVGVAALVGGFAVMRSLSIEVGGAMTGAGGIASLVGLFMRPTPPGGSRVPAFRAYNADLARRLGTK